MARKQSSAFSTSVRRAGHFLSYLCFRAVELVLALLPLTLIAYLGRAIGSVAYYLAGPYRRLALENLRIAFGRESTEDERRGVAREHFASLASNIFCGLKLPLMSEREIIDRVVTEGTQNVANVIAQGHPLLFAVHHLSCWELLTQVPSLFLFGQRGASIYQPLANPYLDAHVRRRREKLGYKLFDRSKGFNGPMAHLRTGGALGILVDQHAGDKGVWCPFFDRLASTTTLPALMAVRLKAPLLPIGVYDAGPGRWRLVFYPPVNAGVAEPTPEQLTAALNIAIEHVVRVAPANWFWVHNRWKTPKPDFLLANYRRGVTLPIGYDVQRLQKFELLLRSPNWLGDACMAFPAVRALRNGRPDLRLSVLTPGKLADLWKSLGIIDDIICKDGKEGVRAVSRRLTEGGHRFDAAILFTNSLRSTLELWLAGIPRLVGFRGSLRSRLLHQITPEARPGQPPEHQVLKYMRLANQCGAKTDDLTHFAVGQPPRSHDGVLRVGIVAGAEYGPAKRWPMERFAAMANMVSAHHSHVEWVLYGAPGEKEQGAQLSAMLTAKHLNLVGQTSLTDLIECLRECNLLVTNDTGTMHLASALGVPTVSLFGSTEPILTGPRGPSHTIVRHHVPCSPCFKRECPLGHYNCLTGILPTQVAEAVARQLMLS